MKTKGPSERQIEQQIDDYLKLDGWRVYKTDLPHLRGLGVQERGMPDRQYVRYPAPTSKHLWALSSRKRSPAESETIWCEHKRRDRYSKKESCWLPTKASLEQRKWHAAERALGALTLIAGEDFEASLDGFVAWYEASGLQRKKVKLG